jgi:MoaA/NifB/PqqE/SkfB family radical SAM enzyme
MCNIWMSSHQSTELDLKTIEGVLSNPVFSKVEHVVLHGGEPTLRKDIGSIYGIFLRFCPRLKSITISTNGLEPAVVEKRLRDIVALENPREVSLTFTVSLDGLRRAHEEIRGVPGAFDRGLCTLEMLKSYQKSHPLEIEIITVIQPQNLGDLEAMMDLAGRYGVGLIFQPLMVDTFYGNSDCDPRLRFSGSQLDAYRKFIAKHLVPGNSTRSLYWRNYLEMMDGGRRRIPCAYDRYVLSLYPTGEVLPCAKETWNVFGNIRDTPVDRLWFGSSTRKIMKRMRRESCPTCSFYCGAEYSLRKEFFTYAMSCLKLKLGSAD